MSNLFNDNNKTRFINLATIFKGVPVDNQFFCQLKTKEYNGTKQLRQRISCEPHTHRFADTNIGCNCTCCLSQILQIIATGKSSWQKWQKFILGGVIAILTMRFLFFLIFFTIFIIYWNTANNSFDKKWVAFDKKFNSNLEMFEHDFNVKKRDLIRQQSDMEDKVEGRMQQI